MTYARAMKMVTLEKKATTQNAAGQKVSGWTADRPIALAVYPVSGSVLNSSNVRFNQSTNTGLTPDRGIKETELKDGNRINDGGTIYNINFVNSAGRFAQLLLQKVI